MMMMIMMEKEKEEEKEDEEGGGEKDKEAGGGEDEGEDLFDTQKLSSYLRFVLYLQVTTALNVFSTAD